MVNEQFGKTWDLPMLCTHHMEKSVHVSKFKSSEYMLKLYQKYLIIEAKSNILAIYAETLSKSLIR